MYAKGKQNQSTVKRYVRTSSNSINQSTLERCVRTTLQPINQSTGQPYLAGGTHSRNDLDGILGVKSAVTADHQQWFLQPIHRADRGQDRLDEIFGVIGLLKLLDGLAESAGAGLLALVRLRGHGGDLQFRHSGRRGSCGSSTECGRKCNGDGGKVGRCGRASRAKEPWQHSLLQWTADLDQWTADLNQLCRPRPPTLARVASQRD